MPFTEPILVFQNADSNRLIIVSISLLLCFRIIDFLFMLRHVIVRHCIDDIKLIYFHALMFREAQLKNEDNSFHQL